MVYQPESQAAEQLWLQVVQLFRRACMVRARGAGDEAAALLGGELRQAIAAWSKVCAETETNKRRLLSDMFEREQKRVDEAAVMSDLLEGSFRESLVPMVSNAVTRRVTETMRTLLHRRGETEADADVPVPIDDVVGMIDNLLTQEQTRRLRRGRPRPRVMPRRSRAFA